MKNCSSASNKIALVILAGPTAVGKTATAIALAQAIDGEIISADSMQIYQMMAIGSAKPTDEECAAVRHHLIDYVDPLDNYSVAQYYKAAKMAIDDVVSRGKQPIISGGTGLYIHSLIYDFNFTQVAPNAQLRHQLEDYYKTHGHEALYERLKQSDPAAAERIHPNNVKRVMRALEVCAAARNVDDFSSAARRNPNFDIDLFVLTRPRAQLYQRIEQRVDKMLASGQVDEVKQLIDYGLTDAHQAMKGIGYKEIYQHLQGQIDYCTMVDLLKRNTRRYAKRQLTWLRRYDFAHWIDLSIRKNSTSVVKYIVDVLMH